MGFTPDLLSGAAVLAIQPANAGAAGTLTGTALSLSNLTGKLLIVCSVGTVAGTISCQLQSCTSSGGANATNFGAAFGIAAGTTSFQVDLETFPAGFIRSVVTIVTSSTPVSITGFAFQKIV